MDEFNLIEFRKYISANLKSALDIKSPTIIVSPYVVQLGNTLQIDTVFVDTNLNTHILFRRKLLISKFNDFEQLLKYYVIIMSDVLAYRVNRYCDIRGVESIPRYKITNEFAVITNINEGRNLV